jgi:superfamily II DNA or RNA helicase
MHTLREYQVKIIDSIEAQIKYGKRRIMLQLPTGAGKTRCFVELAKRHRLNPYASDRNCLIVAHRKELIDQAVLALKKEKINEWEIGVIKAGEIRNPNRVIQVASILSLIRTDFPKAGLVIIDEAHHATAETYQQIINHYKDSIILGVTATPARTDGKGFRGSFEILLKGPNVTTLTAQKYLCPYKLYAYTKQRIDTSSVRIQAGDYQLNQLADVVMQSEVRADLVDSWKKHAFGKQTVVFAVNVELSKQYAAAYNDAGYRAEHIDGDTPAKVRTAILERFKDGRTKILCNCNIVTEGFDVPEMQCVQIVRPTKSLIFWLQMIGRSLRTSKGKTHAIILDHTDNYQRLGLPDSKRQWSLDGVNFSGYTPSINIGENNYHQKRDRELQHKDGELVEIYSNSDEINLKELEILSHPKNENIDMVKIKIDNIEYEVTQSLATVISQKLKRLDTVEQLLIKKEEDLLADNQINIYSIRDLQEEVDKLNQELLEKQKQLNTSEDRAYKFEEISQEWKKKFLQIHQYTNKIVNVLNSDFKDEELEEDEDLNTILANCTEDIRLDPNNALAYNNRGVAKSDLGNHYGAISDYSEAIRLNPNDPDNTSIYYYNRGRAKADLEDKNGALIDYTEAIRHNPNNGEIYYHRGIIISGLGDKSEALANFYKATALFNKEEDIEFYQITLKAIEEIEKLSP